MLFIQTRLAILIATIAGKYTPPLTLQIPFLLSFLLMSLSFHELKRYSKIPLLRPPLGMSKSGLKDHFWTVPKVVSNQMYTGCRK